MSEKIIILHPENQPEVDIYPIIKEGSIPNSVIDNQKIKSRTIINSNIALNTLKYEVLHQTLKDLIDSKITQVNMENYLTSYYYNVEETQQYVGSEINTLHQTIQNEFYSNTTIDNMLIEKTDLSLFRQYLPGTFLDLDKQQDNQTSKLNIHADGSIFLTNSGNKTNSGNYYLPNSIVKTEDAPNGYFVLSTTNDDYQSLYNLGAYDKITTNSDGTYTITRQTGYLTINAEDITAGTGSSVNSSNAYVYKIDKDTNAIYDWDKVIGVSSNGFSVKCLSETWCKHETIGIGGTYKTITIGFSSVKTQAEIQALCPIYIQYKLATTTTEKVEKNHYAVYNQKFILEHNKSEAERSANLWDEQWEVGILNDTTGIKEDGYSNTIRSKNFIKCLPNTSYKNYVENSTDLVISIFFYDISGNFISKQNRYCNYDTGPFVTPNNCYYLMFYLQASYGTTYKNDIMINEGSVTLPYQQYEGKTIHEKELENTKNEINNAKQDKLVSNSNIKTINGKSILGSGDMSISGTIPIYNVTQLYKHYYELENQVGDTIHVTCWSTKTDKIPLIDITRYAFSNVQVYNSTNGETIQVIKWDSSGFRFINDVGNIDSNGYTVTHYYINGEPTTY